MAHRFTNLQNEFGKPVIAAGTKKPSNVKDSIHVSWLKTTDDSAEGDDALIVVKSTFNDKIEEINNAIDDIKFEGGDYNDSIKAIQAEMGVIKEALKTAITLTDERDITLSNGTYTLNEGETFISATVNGESILPTLKVTNNETVLHFTDGDVMDGIKIVTAKKVTIGEVVISKRTINKI